MSSGRWKGFCFDQFVTFFLNENLVQVSPLITERRITKDLLDYDLLESKA